jgi:hypothetical protein
VWGLDEACKKRRSRITGVLFLNNPTIGLLGGRIHGAAWLPVRSFDPESAGLAGGDRFRLRHVPLSDPMASGRTAVYTHRLQAKRL